MGSKFKPRRVGCFFFVQSFGAPVLTLFSAFNSRLAASKSNVRRSQRIDGKDLTIALANPAGYTLGKNNNGE